MQSLLILGRQPELGLAEIESLYGSDKVSLILPNVALLDTAPDLIDFKRLGGSLKLAKVLADTKAFTWQDIEKFLLDYIPKHSAQLSEGKITLGFSTYGFKVDLRVMSKTGLSIKRAIQKTGRSVRLVPNKEPELNTAQVIHNKLTKERSYELLIVRTENQTFIAQTSIVQDITRYAKRDQARPYRDSKIGMLPPKLAQIIVNLAAGQAANTGSAILDPFCGTGVILQEALLMGYDVIGSDINDRMVEYSKNNLRWISDKYGLSINLDNINIGDALNTTWSKFDFIASETNLGKPLSSIPSKPELSSMINELNKLISGFLVNAKRQTKPGTRVCLAVPAWQIANNEFKRLPVIDQLTDLGYNFVDFKHINSRELIYYRPDQLVARQLLTLVRN